MIRINLSPTAKRKTQHTRAITQVQMALPSTSASKGSIYGLAMLLGWIALGAVGWFLLGEVKDDAARLQAKAKKLNEDAAEINAQIDEEGLQARFNHYEELSAAVDVLQEKRRTPVYVYHELTKILTTGEMPDIDEAEQRKRVNLDPQARLDLDWDAQAVWLNSMEEDENDVLAITGGARDPDDLSEFVKRLRASARFARVSHPEFKFEEVTATASEKESKPGQPDHNHYTFELTARVRYWD